MPRKKGGDPSKSTKQHPRHELRAAWHRSFYRLRKQVSSWYGNRRQFRDWLEVDDN